jgi:hypothetical protein
MLLSLGLLFISWPSFTSNAHNNAHRPLVCCVQSEYILSCLEKVKSSPGDKAVSVPLALRPAGSLAARQVADPAIDDAFCSSANNGALDRSP